MDAPPVRFTTTPDGTQIAFSAAGHVFVDFYTHSQLYWGHPNIAPWMETVAEQNTVILIDLPGCGLSGSETGWLSAERLADAIASVIAALGYDRVSLLSSVHVGMVLIHLAATRPELVDRLVLFCPYASGPAYRDNPSVQAIGLSQRTDWDTGLTATLAVGSSADWTPGEVASLRELINATITPQNLFRYFAFFGQLDVSDLLPRVQAPTLVLTRTDNRMHPLALARAVAAGIPNAEFRILPGQSLVPSDAPSAISAILEFLAGAHSRGEVHHGSSFRTLLFTDLESSTALTQQLGDAKAQEVLHGHNDAVRAALTAHDGTEVKHTGDGIFAAFGSAVSAVEAALQIQRDLAGGEVRVRVGLNAGEPIAEDDDYFGTAVQLAARVCDRAEPGQVLVSNVVRELCAGKTFAFTDQGEATLKGFPEPVRLFVVGEHAQTGDVQSTPDEGREEAG